MRTTRFLTAFNIGTCPDCGTGLGHGCNTALNILLAAGLAEGMSNCGGYIRLRLDVAIPEEAVTTD